MYRIRPWLYTGSYRITRQADKLQAYQIGAMLLLFRPVTQPGIASLYLRIEDGHPIPASDLQRGISFIEGHRTAERSVLIACGAGNSRSTTFATAALKSIEGLPLFEAFLQIRKANPRAMPDEVHWQSLCRYFDEDVAFWQMWRKLEL
jgi:protein-tyrosine phosphatase